MAKLALQTSNTFAYSIRSQSATTSNSYVRIADHPSLNLGGSSFTAECWLKPDGIYPDFSDYFTKGSAGFSGVLGTTGYVGFWANGTSNTTSSLRLATNRWSHIAYVFNSGANLQIYVNGTQVAVNSALTTIANVAGDFFIGSPKTINKGYSGEISNFRIVKDQAIYSGNFVISTTPFNLPNNAIGLSGTNVAASLTGNVVVLTCNDQKIQSNGNTVLTVTHSGDVYPHAIDTSELQTFSYFFPANNFGGNASVIATNSTNSLNINADFTMEMWYYPTVNSGTVIERGIGGVTNNSAAYIITWDTPNNTLNFAVSNANNNTYCLGSVTGSAGSLGTPTLNAWNHIAVTRATNTWRGFLNGTLNLNVATNSNTPYFPPNRGLTIGGQWANGAAYGANTPSNTISGYISTLRIIRGNSIYNAAFTTPTSVLGNVTNNILLTGITPGFVDLTGTHAVAANGMSTISFSTFNPFTPASVGNANAANVSIGVATLGYRQTRIYNKLDYSNFNAPITIFNTVGDRQGRIYNKLDYNNFNLPVPIFNAVGSRQGKVYDKSDYSSFAYIPMGGLQTTNQGSASQYEFWS